MGVPYFTKEEIGGAQALIQDRYAKGSWIVGLEEKTHALTNKIKERFGTEASILEIGSGSGKTLAFFISQGFKNIKGVDIDNYLLDKSLTGNLLLADLNNDSFPVADKSQEVVLAFEIFEHLENPFRVARDMARVLKPGGLLFLSMPYGHTLWDKIKFFVSGNLINYHPKNNHITFLTKDIFNKVFNRDFELEENFFDHGWIPFLRPRRWNKYLPPHPWWSLKVCYVLKRK